MAEYTTKDVKDKGYNLEPLTCIHCGHTGEITYNQYIGDGICGICGGWQEDEKS